MRATFAPFAFASILAGSALACGSSSTTSPEATSGGGGAASTASTSGHAGGSGTTTEGTGGSHAGGGPGTGGAAPELGPASGVSITEVALYQGPKKSLFGGSPSPGGVDTPVVAGRGALVRLFLTSDGSYDGSPVTARLHLGAGAPIEATSVVHAAKDEDLASTLNLEVPPERMQPGTSAHVEILQPPGHGSGAAGAARWPASGEADLGVSSDGASLKLVIVPILYGADGTNRAPDTSPAQLDGYRALFMSMYPLAKIDLTVREPWTYDSAVYAKAFWTWKSLTGALSSLRDDDHVDDDVYYFGVFQPADTFDDYCPYGCTTGNGYVGTPDDPSSHVAVGLGYSGADYWGTAIHEVGHTQGRLHAPCGGASGPDPDFPYDEAGIGVWFYDLVAKQLVSPGVGKDMMGYCDPYTISDYTFRGIFDEMRVVSGAKKVIAPKDEPRRWERADVGEDGSLTLMRPLRRAGGRGGQTMRLTVRTARGERVVQGRFLPYSDVPGGVVTWPAGDEPAIAARLAR